MLTITPINFNIIKPEHKKQSHKNINFCGLQSLGGDIFEQTAKKISLKIFNPFSHSYSEGEVISTLNKPQIFTLTKNSRKAYDGTKLEVDFDPARTDFLFDKINKKPIKTIILKITDNKNQVGYNFMSENLEHEYGYVNFSIHKDKTSKTLIKELLEDRPEQGIIGPKLIVDYLRNWDNETVGGIGHLADKLAVKYCLDNNLPVNIVSVADKGSHMAHYLRGKRFFPLEEGSYTWDYYKETFGETDINKILAKEAEFRTPNKKIKPDMSLLAMYMPQNLVEKYKQELLLKS